MASDMVTFARVEDERQTAYLDYLMLVMTQLARLKISLEAFTGNDYIVSVVEFINSGNVQLKVRALDLVGKLSEDNEYRKLLSSKDVFSQLTKLINRLIRTPNKDLRVIAACLRGLMFFTRDKPNIIILVNLQGQAGLFAMLCDSLNGKNYEEAIGNEADFMQTRVSAGLIINNILVVGGVDGISGVFLKLGALDGLAAVITDKRAKGVQLIAHKLTTEFANHITNAVDKYEVIVAPLVFSLHNDKVVSNNLLALDAIQRFLVYERLQHLFIEAGLVGNLCTIISENVSIPDNIQLVI